MLYLIYYLDRLNALTLKQCDSIGHFAIYTFDVVDEQQYIYFDIRR